MNATVKRIVEIMFNDVEMTDEVQTLQDEIMANCQERFQDGLNRGLTEDEAIHAVVESLKGMEEVLAAYPKKQKEQPVYTAANYADSTEGNQRTFAFDAASIRRIQVNLLNNDVDVAPSPDACFHVITEDELVEAAATGDSLHITRENQKGETFKYHGNLDFSNLSNLLKFAFKGSSVNHKVTIQVPPCQLQELNINTTSGDIDLEQIWVKQLNCNTASGDVTVYLHEAVHHATLHTASGDVEAHFDAAALDLNTMSGDIRYQGTCPQMNVRTVSGDGNMDGQLTGQLHTVSGDFSLHLEKGSRIQGNTTSGDVIIKLAPSADTVNASLTSVSGDLHNHRQDMGSSSDVIVAFHTVSGNVVVR